MYLQYHEGRNILKIAGERALAYTGNTPLCLDLLTSISLGVLMAGFEYLITKPLPTSSVCAAASSCGEKGVDAVWAGRGKG